MSSEVTLDLGLKRKEKKFALSRVKRRTFHVKLHNLKVVQASSSVSKTRSHIQLLLFFSCISWRQELPLQMNRKCTPLCLSSTQGPHWKATTLGFWMDSQHVYMLPVNSMLWFTDQISSLHWKQKCEGVECNTIKYGCRKTEKDLRKGDTIWRRQVKKLSRKSRVAGEKSHTTYSNLHSKYFLKW